MCHVIAFVIISATPQYTVESEQLSALAGQVLPAICKSVRSTHGEHHDYLCMYNSGVLDVDARDIKEIVPLIRSTSVWEKARKHLGM